MAASVNKRLAFYWVTNKEICKENIHANNAPKRKWISGISLQWKFNWGTEWFQDVFRVITAKQCRCVCMKSCNTRKTFLKVSTRWFWLCLYVNEYENGALRILHFLCPPCYLNKYWKQLDQFSPLCLRNCFSRLDFRPFCEHAFLFPHHTSRGWSTIGLPKLILMPSWTRLQMTQMLHSRMNEKMSEHWNSDCS